MNTSKTTSALTIALILHACFLIYLAFKIKTEYKNEEVVGIEMIELPQPRLQAERKSMENLFERQIQLNRDMSSINVERRMAISSPERTPEVIFKTPEIVQRSSEFNPAKVTSNVLPEISTAAKARQLSRDFTLPSSTSTPPSEGGGRGIVTGRIRAGGIGAKPGLSIVDSVGTRDDAGILGGSFGGALLNPVSLPEGKLGAVLVGKGADVQAHIRIIRLKHSLADWWQDPTALPSLIEWLKENTKIRADMNAAGGALAATDPMLLESAIVFITGHDREMVASRNLSRNGPLVESFSDQERRMIRKYLVEKGGTLFFDDCGFDGHFAEKIRQELQDILPEYNLKNIYNNHEIFKIYYDLPKAPTGGDVFWKSENNPQASKFLYLDGITIGRRLAMIYNRKDYMCAMETADIPSRTQLRLRRSSDVYKFMTNVLFYAMKYGGNVDRSDYKP